MLIPQPRQLQQLITPNAGAIAQGLNQGMSLANQYQQNQLGQQTQQLNQMQLDQAQQAMTKEQAQEALGSIAQGAETVMSLPTDDQRYNFLANRRDQLAAQGRNTEQTDDALRIGMNEGFTSPAFDQAMQEGLQTANSMGVYTEQQQLQRAAQAKAQADSTLGLKDKNKLRQDFRKEFTSTAGKGLLESKEQIAKIRNAKKTGIGDVALMKTVNKMIDSGIVTSDDFNQVAQSSGLADNWEGMFKKILGQGELNEVTRGQIIDQAESLYNAKLVQAKDISEGIKADASTYGIEKEVIPSAYNKLFADIASITEDAPAQEVNTTGWTPMQDANGNRALVGPNGEIKEL